MSFAKSVVAAASLVLAGAIGLQVGRRSQSSLATARVVDGSDPAAAATLREENQRLRKALASTAPVTSDAGSASRSSGVDAGGRARAAALESLRVLTDLQRRRLIATDLKLIADGTVTAEFETLFALTAGERETLQREIDATRARLDTLERDNTSVSRAPNGDVTIAMKPYPEAGGATYDAMLKSFAETLGQERYNAFLALGAEQAEKTLGRFGTAERVVTVSREVDASGDVRYRIRARTQNTPQDTSSYVSDRLTPERFESEIGPLIKQLPPDFVPRR